MTDRPALDPRLLAELAVFPREQVASVLLILAARLAVPLKRLHDGLVAIAYPTKTAHRTLEDLSAYGVLERIRCGPGKSDRWKMGAAVSDEPARWRDKAGSGTETSGGVESGATDVPRLTLAGADLERVATVAIKTPEGDERPPLVTPEDLDHVEAAVRDVGARLVVFDPLAAYVDEQADLHRNQDARRVMARLHALAERVAGAVVGVHHFNRGQHPEAAHRLTGSLGLPNAARSALVAALDPDDASGERCVLALAKHNLAPRTTPSMAFRLVVADGAEHPRVEWLGASALSTNDLVAPPVSPEDRPALEAARELLRGWLEGGEPVRAGEILEDARANGISERTLNTAKAALDILAKRQGGFGKRRLVGVAMALLREPPAPLGASLDLPAVTPKDAACRHSRGA